jgi:hypothetical protein
MVGFRAMSICVAFNLSDGVVMAVDSATTVTDSSGTISKVFIDADKLFQLGNLKIGIATYGVAALEGRTIGSFLREFTSDPTNADMDGLSLAVIVERLRVFFFDHYKAFAEKVFGVPFDQIEAKNKGILGLVVGGFSSGTFQSELWEIVIPTHETPNSARNVFATGKIGLSWFASAVPIGRYLQGVDWGLIGRIEAFFKGLLGRDLTQDEVKEALKIIAEHEYRIKTDGMPIQSGIDCARFLVEFVLGHYRFAETHPIVGGKAKIGVVTYSHSAFRILE